MIDLNKIRELTEKGRDVNGNKSTPEVFKETPKGEEFKKYEEFKYATQEERQRIVEEDGSGFTPEQFEKKLKMHAEVRVAAKKLRESN
jgi:hypothetical protein